MICKSLRECFTADQACHDDCVTVASVLLLSLSEGRILAVVLMRISQYLFHKRGIWRLARYVKRLNEFSTGFECHLNAQIDAGIFLAHSQNIVIGESVIIGKNVTLYNGVTLGAQSRVARQRSVRYPIVEDEVIIYCGAKVLGGIIIGKGAVVGANAVVLRSIPAGQTAVGVPAGLIDSASE